MNIFETIGNVSRRTERYHSQFLAEALTESLHGDRSLFEGVWKLATPGWEVPNDAEVTPEHDAGSGQIDICIHTDNPEKRVVGIEVKTAAASAEPGQLERYYDGLKENFPQHTVQVAYLTEFNRERAGDKADTFSAVRIFEGFGNKHEDARHISWLDVADIAWDGNDLWKQHQLYVYQHISSYRQLMSAQRQLNRGLTEFFDERDVERFRDRLAELGIQLGEDAKIIELSDFADVPTFARSFANTLAILLDSQNVSRNAKRSDRSDELRQRFLDSPHREVHKALFDLADAHRFVWVRGERDYGVITAHNNHPGGVSLVRSGGLGRLIVGDRR